MLLYSNPLLYETAFPLLGDTQAKSFLDPVSTQDERSRPKPREDNISNSKKIYLDIKISLYSLVKLITSFTPEYIEGNDSLSGKVSLHNEQTEERVNK